MTPEQDKWLKLKNNYLREVEQALASTGHPKSGDVLRDVDEHLDRKYAELSPDKQNWEGCQQILIEMGPPEEYAELLTEEKTPAVQSTSGINTFLAAVFVIVLIIVGGYLIYNAKNAPAPATTSRGVEFEPDERVLGKWITVDFVRIIGNFDPSRKNWQEDLFLLSLEFQDNGEVEWRAENRKPTMLGWTKGKVESFDKRPSFYYLRDINGETYLFYEWISGDVTIRGQAPYYYVLKKKAPDTSKKQILNQPVTNATNNVDKIPRKDTFKNVSLRPGVNADPQNENQSMDRTLYFKLPLAQPKFHWKFTNKDLYLSGKLVLRIISDDQVNEIVVFNKGKITEGWKVICSEHGPQDNAIYFGFQSTTKYSTKPSDKVELELIAKEDINGIGRLQTGVLKADTYKAKGKLKIYSQVESDRAYLEWQDKWLLEITSEKGWMTSELGFFINDNGTMRSLTRAEKIRICAGASWRSGRFFGNSDITLMEKSVSEIDNENHFRKIRIRKGVINTRTDITEFTNEKHEQIRSETTLVSGMDSNGYFTQRFEHFKKKVFFENVDLDRYLNIIDSDLNIFKFGKIDPEIAITIGVLCYLYDNDNQAELFETATTFNDAADVDRFQLIDLKDNSIVYTLELNKMDWGLCRKIQWYHKGRNTLSKSVEYTDFNRPVEFKALADPGDSGYLLPYKTVRQYFDNDGNEEKTETLEIVDAAMASRRKGHDYDTMRQNYETDFDIIIPHDYAIIDRRSQGTPDTGSID